METGRKRKQQIIIRLSDDEYSLFKSKLEKTRLTQREYILNLILEKPIFVIHELDAIEEQIRKIGININQIAKKTNINSYATESDFKEIKEEQVKIWQLLRQLRAEPL